MTTEEAKYILRNTAFLAPSLVPVDEAVDMACDALDKVAYINSQLGKADRKTELQTERPCETCRHWKYIAHEWQCEITKCQGYTPKTEPQTERKDHEID